jgi:hypothetical protein
MQYSLKYIDFLVAEKLVTELLFKTKLHNGQILDKNLPLWHSCRENKLLLSQMQNQKPLL